VRLTLAPELARRREELLASLRAGSPRVEVLRAAGDAFYLAPETLLPGEEAVVTQRLTEVLEATARD
jgi:hypothetical protein